MGNSIQPQVNSTKDRLLDFDKTITKASITIPTFGGRRFSVEGKNLSYNDLLKQFAKLIPPNASPEEKTLGNAVFTHLKQLDEKATSTLKKQNIVKKILTAIRSFFGNLTANRRESISDIEKKLQLSVRILTPPTSKKTEEIVKDDKQDTQILRANTNEIPSTTKVEQQKPMSLRFRGENIIELMDWEQATGLSYDSSLTFEENKKRPPAPDKPVAQPVKGSVSGYVPPSKSLEDVEAWEIETGFHYDSSLTFEENKKWHKEVGFDFPELIDALGGREAVLNLPLLKLTKPQRDYIELEPRDLPAPIMRGIDNHGRPFIAIKYTKISHEDSKKQTYVQTLFQRYTDINDSDIWVSGGFDDITFGVRFDIGQDNVKVPMERLQRLVKGESLGLRASRTLPDGNSEYYERIVPGESEIKLWHPPAV